MNAEGPVRPACSKNQHARLGRSALRNHHLCSQFCCRPAAVSSEAAAPRSGASPPNGFGNTLAEALTGLAPSASSSRRRCAMTRHSQLNLSTLVFCQSGLPSAREVSRGYPIIAVADHRAGFVEWPGGSRRASRFIGISGASMSTASVVVASAASVEFPREPSNSPAAPPSMLHHRLTGIRPC